ncbi:MAG: hypothetical protein HOM21_03445, partial [Halobacteriovoraceae bacterium]|nr:hypothetical protein [Halobacteriovoraceae bacterium]
MNLYDEKKLARLLEVQKVKGWDLERDINWSRGIDLKKPLLPLDNNAILFPNASSEQRLVISQMMGLIVASTISQLEDIANRLKVPTWERILDKYPVNPEMVELGEHFYADEIKHSKAFNRYIDLFAKEVNVTPEQLKEFLPSSRNSLLGGIYKLNSMAGGMALWWLIAAVEEESILFFEYIRNVKGEVDPLYYELHKCHYEEELRHKSYASLMLQLNHDFSKVPARVIWQKIDFIIAEILNISWTFNQLFKVKNIKKLAKHHEFFRILDGLSETLEGHNSLGTLHTLFTSAPYISDTLNLSEHQNLKLLMEKYGAY